MILFFGLEASSILPGSFPIEVAWVDEAGQAESYLIRPHEEWLEERAGNAGWSNACAAIHGIGFETLMIEGIFVGLVAARIAEVLWRSHVIACSDNSRFHTIRLTTLLDGGGFLPPFALVDVQKLYLRACHPLRALFPPKATISTKDAERRFQNLANEIITRAVEAEAFRPRVHHRALPDAESLWLTWCAIRTEVERRLSTGGDV